MESFAGRSPEFPVESPPLDQQEIERIARAALRELGVVRAELRVQPDGPPGRWRIDIAGPQNGPGTLRVTCGKGSSPQWLRDQIFAQYMQ